MSAVISNLPNQTAIFSVGTPSTPAVMSNANINCNPAPPTTPHIGVHATGSPAMMLTPGQDDASLIMGCNRSGVPVVVVSADGEIHRIITNFDTYERIGMNDAVKIDNKYANIWDMLYKMPGSRQQGRHLLADPKYIQCIGMYTKYFKDYAGLSLEEFLTSMTTEHDNQNAD